MRTEWYKDKLRHSPMQGVCCTLTDKLSLCISDIGPEWRLYIGNPAVGYIPINDPVRLAESITFAYEQLKIHEKKP